MRPTALTNRIILRMEELASRALPAVLDPTAAVLPADEASDCESPLAITLFSDDAAVDDTVVEATLFVDADDWIDLTDEGQDWSEYSDNLEDPEVWLAWCMLPADETTEYVRCGTVDKELYWATSDDTSVINDEDFESEFDPAVCYATGFPTELADGGLPRAQPGSADETAPPMLYGPAGPTEVLLTSPVSTATGSEEENTNGAADISVAQPFKIGNTAPQTQGSILAVQDPASVGGALDADELELPLSVLAGVKVGE